MPADYIIYPRLDLVLSQAYGRVTDSDLVDHQRRLKSDTQFHPSFNQLFDFTQLSENRLTSLGIQSIAERDPFGAGSKRAFVAGRRDIETFGLLRMFEILTSGHTDELQVQYDDLQSAVAWFGLEPGDQIRLPCPPAEQ